MGNQVSAFSDCCSAEVHEAEEQAGSVKWESLAEVCEGQGGSVVGQEGHCPCGMGSSR